MWRGFAVVIVLGACGFRASATSGNAAIDAAELVHDAAQPVDAAMDGPPVNPSPFCDPADPHLMACYPFEGDAKDSSAHHLDAAMNNLTFPPGKVGKAMLFAANSAADVPDSPVFDAGALTIEAWIWPSQLPTGSSRAGILDMNGQYGFFVHAGGDLRCTLIGGPTLPVATAQITTGRWTHVACTYDGTAAAAIYVDGVAAAKITGGGTLATNGISGISLAADNPPGAGSRLIGLIDEVRLMNVARTAAQICADAGQSACP
jgi:Concanavalin A-like lectin/glucanases superfamily